LAKFSSADGDCGTEDGDAGGVVDAGVDAPGELEGAELPVPLVPHAARNALNPTRVEPCRNRRRLTSWTVRGLRSFMFSS
jgi:hypothetical protein